MKSAPAPLISHLLTGTSFIKADLYTFTLRGGEVLRYTDADVALTVGGAVYSASGPLIERSKLRWTLGLETDTLTLDIYPGPDHQIDTVSFAAAVNYGALDGASLLLQRLFMPIWGDTTTYPPIWYFSGDISRIPVCGSAKIEVEIAGKTERLNIQMPRNLYQDSCRLNLYETGCDVVRSAYEMAGTVVDVDGATIYHDIVTQPITWFALGVLQFTSGSLTGRRFTIKTDAPGSFRLVTAPYTTPEIGDSFLAVPGCDKSIYHCILKFNNWANFRGAPFIPVPEMAH